MDRVHRGERYVDVHHVGCHYLPSIPVAGCADQSALAVIALWHGAENL